MFNVYLLLNLTYNIRNMGIGDWGLGIGDCPIPNPQLIYL